VTPVMRWMSSWRSAWRSLPAIVIVASDIGSLFGWGIEERPTMSARMGQRRAVPSLSASKRQIFGAGPGGVHAPGALMELSRRADRSAAAAPKRVGNRPRSPRIASYRGHFGH
jgi:hypothetical protein